MPKQLIIRPLGLVTRPNKVGQYPIGALAKADGAVMRSAGTIESAPTWSTVTTVSPSPTQAFFVSDASHLCVLCKGSANWNLWYIKSDGSVYIQSLTTSFVPLSAIGSDGVCGLTIVRNRLVITTKIGVFIVDLSVSPASAPADVRPSGVVPCSIKFGTYTLVSSSDSAPALLPAETHAAFLGVMRRIYDDGYEISSPPSAATELHNVLAANAVDAAQVNFYTPTGSYHPNEYEGFFLDLYRTRSQGYSFDGFGTYTQVNFGDSYYLSSSTKKDNTVSTYLIVDRVTEDQLGEALATNQAVAGAAAIPLSPPPCHAVATFQGHTFYINYFDRAQVSFGAAFYWGWTADASPSSIRKRSVGHHQATCDITSGSPVATNLSNTDGMVVGQYFSTTGLALSGVIVSLTSTTVTVDSNASSTGSGLDCSARDVVEVNGTTISADSYPTFVRDQMFSTIGVHSYHVPVTVADISLGSITEPFPQPSGGALLRVNGTESISIRATRGDYWVPKLPRIEASEAAREYAGKWVPYGIQWSEQGQPENCPPSNYAAAGVGELYNGVSTRDALWLFASDGLWRLSGNGGSVGDGYDWRIDPIDQTLSLADRRALCVHNDMVYAYTNRGLVAIDSAGNVAELSARRIGDVLPGQAWSGADWGSSTSVWMYADEDNDEIHLRTPTAWYVYNTNTQAFTTAGHPSKASAVHGVYSKRDRKSFAILESGALDADDGGAGSAVSLRFQPAFGSNSHTHKHWQGVDVVLDAPASAVDVTFTPNGKGALAKTRAASASAAAYEDKSRVGFTVPRNAPASANALSVGVDVAAASAPVRLQSVAVELTEFTEQRRNR